MSMDTTGRPVLVTQGTPGAVNSLDIGAHSGGVAPLIVEAEHAPIIPRSTDSVTVTARVLDEQMAGVTVSLYFRVDGQPAFETTVMLDNGLDPDTLAGDGVFTARIPAYTDDTVVEFYIGAVDADGNARTRPAPCDVNGTPGQVANMLYQVDDYLRSQGRMAASGPAHLSHHHDGSPASRTRSDRLNGRGCR